MTGYEAAVVRVRCWAPGRPTAGLGLLVGDKQVVTCAHVVNTALGRAQREQRAPGAADVVQVEFPLLAGAPVRDAAVAAWVPPSASGMGGDVAGLTLTEQAPDGANFRSTSAAATCSVTIGTISPVLSNETYTVLAAIVTAWLGSGEASMSPLVDIAPIHLNKGHRSALTLIEWNLN